MAQCDFEEADLKKSNFKGADLADAMLVGSQLDFCDFTNANLCNADLSGSSMLCVNLSGANLSGANLEGANLSGSRVDGARFFNASLIGASIGGVNTATAIMTGALMPDGDVFGTEKAQKTVKRRRLSNLLSMRPIHKPPENDDEHEDVPISPSYLGSRTNSLMDSHAEDEEDEPGISCKSNGPIDLDV